MASEHWSRQPLLSLEELRSELRELGAPSAAAGDFLSTHAFDPRADPARATRNSAVARDWLEWCRAQRQRVRVSEASAVHTSLLPRGVSMLLHDVKVGTPSKRRVPDDALYNAGPDLRRRVARGNTILEVKESGQKGGATFDCGIFALKKFTGGMGDEDEQQNDAPEKWMDYFLKDHTTAARVVCTLKENGEAAHMAARWVNDRFLVIAGSKNVHLVASRTDQVDQHYPGPRYQVAREVAKSALAMLDAMDPRRARALLAFLHYTRVTAVFEVLQPTYMHVVDLSHLDAPELRFITWTLPYSETDEREGAAGVASLSALAPDAALDLAAALGLRPVRYEVVDADAAEARMDLVRRGRGYEGEVLYFVDDAGNTIGVLKKKTAWYVVLRALREKVAHALGAMGKGSATADEIKPKIDKRLDEIQKWLGFPDPYLAAWKELGRAFLDYMAVHAAQEGDRVVRGRFPIHWNNFLKATGRKDDLEWK